MKSLPSIDTNQDTFYSWIVKTNGIINLCNTEVVTANNSANGAITTGNGYVIGAFGANTVVASILAGGNTLSTSTLTISTNVYHTANTYRFDPGVIYGANSNVWDHGVRATTSNTSVDQMVDTFSATTYRSAKYVLSVTDVTGNNFQATEILVLSDGNTTYTTEYATLTSAGPISTFRTDISGGNVRLLMTPLVAPVQVNISRTLIAT